MGIRHQTRDGWHPSASRSAAPLPSVVIANESPRKQMTAETPLSIKAAAALLGVDRSFLDRRRQRGGGPPYVRMSSRKIVYMPSTLMAWLAAQERTSTSDIGACARSAPMP